MHARDLAPLDAECSCETCRHHSRAYLRHLFMAGEMLGPILATRHNLHFYADTMRAMRAAIVDGSFETWKRSFVDRFTHGGDGAATDSENETQRRTS